MNLRAMPDSEFQNLLLASYKYDWDLAVKLEGLVSVSQVPDSVWDEFVELYKDYHKPKKEKAKNILKIVVQMSALGVVLFVIFPWVVIDVYPKLPQEVKDFSKPIIDFAVNPLVRIAILIGIYFRYKKQLKKKWNAY